MTVRRRSLDTALTLLILLVFIIIGDHNIIRYSEGQAEDTFGQNSTFFEEIGDANNRTIGQATDDRSNDTSSQIAEAGHRQTALQDSPLAFSNALRDPGAKIVTSGENVYIVWETNETGNSEVMLRVSNDNGETFQEKLNLSNSSDSDSENADIAIAGSNVFIVWDERTSLNSSSETVARISNDNGQIFGPLLRLSANGTIGKEQKFSAFENSTYGLKIQYPSTWDVTFGENDNTNVIDIVSFTSPLEYRLDNYGERLWISLDNLRAQNLTLEEYATNVVNYKNETLQNFRLMDNDTESTILAGRPAYNLIYTSELEDGTILKQMEIGTKVGDKVYYLDYYAEEEKYADFLPIIQEMIASLEIKDGE